MQQLLIPLVILAAYAIFFAIYSLGKAHARRAILRASIGIGTWVKIVRPVKAMTKLGKPATTIEAGIQAIVSDIDKWGRVSIWIAEPWVEMLGFKQAYQIENIERLAIIPLDKIDKEDFAKTIKGFQANQQEYAELLRKIVSRE
jgi:hypothetical protein